jgi:hypothetical protein
VAKFHNTKRRKFLHDFGSPHTSERTSALSLDCSQRNNTRKNFFFVSSVFFVCGIEKFFGLFFPKTLFFIQKSSYKTPLEETLIFFKVTARATEEEKELIKKCLFSPPKILITFLFVISLKEVYFLFCLLLS